MDGLHQKKIGEILALQNESTSEKAIFKEFLVDLERLGYLLEIVLPMELFDVDQCFFILS